jgi:hypothetical protein
MDYGWIVNLFGLAFNWLRSMIETLLNITLFKLNPELVNDFASTIALLITLTTIYIILVLISSSKKIIGIVLALGWGLLALSLIISAI